MKVFILKKICKWASSLWSGIRGTGVSCLKWDVLILMPKWKISTWFGASDSVKAFIIIRNSGHWWDKLFHKTSKESSSKWRQKDSVCKTFRFKCLMHLTTPNTLKMLMEEHLIVSRIGPDILCLSQHPHGGQFSQTHLQKDFRYFKKFLKIKPYVYSLGKKDNFGDMNS